uniref:DNA cross-link repair 1A protein-like n=1 Tax=Castor canadensis TaxID=51338 RepID=A0A8B7WDN9_CASCN|nr:DNA cross-link repair 1A protein-like [Castor canadensis]
MLENTFLEEDIWEYKSKRKPKPVHPNSCSENIPKSVEKATYGNYQSKRKRKEKKAGEEKGKVKDHEMCLGEADCKTSGASSQSWSCRDGTQPSQDKETTPRKQGRAPKSKQVSPKIRPVYDGYCPSCQMPFSSLLGQTPQWHVFECLDSTTVSNIECPDGARCTSTFPSHYKKYTHLLLAQSRASSEPFSSPPPASGWSVSETKPSYSCNLEERWFLHPKSPENFKNASDDSLLMTQCLKKSQPPLETNKKITSSQKLQQVLQSTEFVKKDKLVGVGLPLAEELDGQSNSQCTNLSLPENDFGSCEISYSPLQSDEETYAIDEKLDDSQQELFFTESSKDDSLEYEDLSIAFKRPGGPFLKNAEEHRPEVNSFFTQNKYNELLKCRVLNDFPQLFSQTESSVSDDKSSYTDGHFLLFAPALTGELPASNYQTTKANPDEPQFPASQSNKQKQVIEESAVCSQVSLPLLKSEMSKPLESWGGKGLSFPPTQSQMRELSSENFCAKNSSNSECVCRKALCGMLDGKVKILNTETVSTTPTAAKSSKILPSGSKCSASHSSAKGMKQMDIGVYFGLPPKRREEKSLRDSALKGMNLDPVVSPKKKRSQPCKRKAENSLSDLEFDAKNLNESQCSVELTWERSQRQRKRQKKSNSPQKGAHQKRSHHLNNNTESETVISKDKVFIKSAHSRLQRGNVRISGSSDAGELRKKRCPFYKRIPGTSFTVDAFQYGVVEGCTAYFLTHFHSDHYAGLSRNFTFPVYCSEVSFSILNSDFIENRFTSKF